MKTFSVELSFVAPEQGGRSTLPIDFATGQYRPHLIVAGTTELLGVQFVAGPKNPTHEVPAMFNVTALYEGVDYSRLVPGASFSVVEGPRVVAHGIVKARS